MPVVEKEASIVDTTVRLKWEITKDEFDSCDSIDSDNYAVKVGSESSWWFITMYPRGVNFCGVNGNENQVAITMELMGTDKDCDVHSGSSNSRNGDVLLGFGLETPAGYWPNGDLVEKRYTGRGVNLKKRFHINQGLKFKNDNWGDSSFCTTEDFRQQFVQDKVTLVATLVFVMEGKRYLQQQEVTDAFLEDVRSIPHREDLSDITVICRGKHFPCHKVLLAARSKYFEALFRHDQQKKMVNVEEASPDIVQTMLEFMAKGLIPSDIDAKAMDLIELADMYRIDLLSEVCLTSIVNNLSPDNALEALVILDKLEHVSKSEQRHEILAYIRKEAAQIASSNNWENFYRNYPNLVAEMFLSACNATNEH